MSNHQATSWQFCYPSIGCKPASFFAIQPDFLSDIFQKLNVTSDKIPIPKGFEESRNGRRKGWEKPKLD